VVVLSMEVLCPILKERIEMATKIMDARLIANPASLLGEVEGHTTAAFSINWCQGEGNGRTEDHGGITLVEDDIVLAGVDHGTGEVVQEARS
jgi:hypothetical protein